MPSPSEPLKPVVKTQGILASSELFSLILALLMVLLIVILYNRAWAAIDRNTAQLAVTQRILSQTNALVSLITDAETGQRGFLLTGKASYLDPYQRAVADLPATLEALNAVVLNHSDQASRLARLRPLVAEKINELTETIDLAQKGHTDEAVAIVRTDRGKVLMDRIRELCLEMDVAAQQRLLVYSWEARASTRNAGLIAIAGSTILFALLGLATVTIQRATRRRLELIESLERSEQQAREAHNWLEITLASIGDGVIATDAAGRVTLLNPVAQRLTGWSEEEARGVALERVFVINNEETGAPPENPATKAFREGSIIGLANHTRLISKDGRAYSIDDSAAPIRSLRGEAIGVVVVFRDVTWARAQERERERSRRALAAANKDLQQFAYAASHDLREPLRTINAFSHLLLTNIPELSDQNRECLEFLITAASRMDALVNALLAYSTVDAGAGQPLAEVDAATVLAGVLENLRTAMDESGTVVTHDFLPQVTMESAHLGQIFQNLISNAIKYRGGDSPRIHVSSKLTSGEWVFSVADNGIGIEPKYHAEIFDVFKRLHPQEVSGSGIGLATYRRIIERYRGRI
jgi:PAS domain S-box-containing protein